MRENVLSATGIEGSALVTGSLAVEVCCGALQHPKGVGAPAAQNDVAASSSTSQQDAVLPLGPVPHMIRSAASALGFAASLCLVHEGSGTDRRDYICWSWQSLLPQDPHCGRFKWT